MRRMLIGHVNPPRDKKPLTRKGAADRDAPLAMKAELVGESPGDPAADAVRRKRLRTARDQRQARERLADADDAVAGLIAVDDDCCS